MDIFRRLYIALVVMLAALPSMAQTEANPILINEIMSANVDCYVDPSWNYGGWIELYNTGTGPRQLRGWWVSDDPNNLKKVHITQSTIVYGNSYKNLWFEHHDKYCPSQVDMKLDLDGGTIYLSDSQGNLVCSADYPPAIQRASWARVTDGADEWTYTNQCTPQASNGNVAIVKTRLDPPEPSLNSTIFSGTTVCRITIPSGNTLRYTTDGSTPTLTNGKTSTTGVFVVTNTTIYRFAYFRDGYLSSPVIERSYLKKDKDFSLPVMLVNTASDNLYSDKMGILVRGTNGRPGLGQSSNCNWNMDWDRPMNFELIDENGKSLVNQECEIARCGGWSRASNPCSFKVHAANLYEGKKAFDYEFFEDKPHLKHRTLQIRNGGNDNSCRVKDAFLQKLVITTGLDVDAQAYQPVAHYINGIYKGVINMREANNKQYVYSNFGLDEDEIDQFEIDCDSGYVQKCGTREAFERWYELAKTADNDETYAEIEKLVDIDEYCNYMAVELYLGNWDWPQNNMKAWRPTYEGGRFRYILYDLDGSFSVSTPLSTFAGKTRYTFNELYGCSVSSYTLEVEPVTIFLNMLKSAKFRRHFADAFCLCAGSVFEPTRCNDLITEWANKVYPMQILDDNGYGKNYSPWSTANDLISNLSSRATAMYSHLKSYSAMKLSSTTPSKVKLSSNISDARLFVNDQIVPTGKFNGQLFPPVTFRAEAPAGYVFDGWQLRGAAAGTTLINYGDYWTYYDKGSLDGKSWKILGYSTSSWAYGQSPLGYGKASTGYTTTISYGGNSSNKYTCYYFRKNVGLSNTPSADDKFYLNYMVDDGFVVYVNGEEAGRYNMPQGDVTFSTVANTYAETDPNEGSLELDASLFKKGINVVAVEVHQNSNTSSDIYWNACLSYEEPSDDIEYVSKDPEYEMPTGTQELVAHFSLAPDESGQANSCPIRINEVSAANSVYVNEYFKKADWVELYNSTSEDVDLAGMYLSDKLDEPLKYQISAEGSQASTVIPAHGYRIIWCDKEEPMTQLHAQFKLNNEDSCVVVLTAADQSTADTLIYCAHDGGQSVGRFPDGGEKLYVMTRPTMETQNWMNMYTTLYEPPVIQTDPTGIGDVCQARDGALSIRYTRGELCLKSEEDPNVVLTIYTLSGSMALQQPLELEDISTRYAVTSLSRGIYVAQLKDSQGNAVSTKFIIQ